MIQEPIFLFNGALLAAAMFFAMHAGQGRREAVVAAIGLGGNFLFCALAFTDYSPARALHGIGIDMTNKETWMLADTMFGASCVLLGWRHWWGYALCGTAMAQILIHGARIDGAISADAYSQFLDFVLHGQMAVFFFLGGKGVGNLLHSTLAQLGGLRRLHASARACSESDR